jgi:Replication-relaxation
MVTIKQLYRIHNLGSYRNTCRVIAELSPYLHEERGKEKIVYLNKEGRELIGSTKEVRKNAMMQHTLLCNEAYIYFGCPSDWKTEYRIEVENHMNLEITIRGVNTQKKMVIADASFKKDGHTYLIEIDNTRHMIDNYKKIEKYAEILPLVRKQFEFMPTVYFITTTEERKKKLSERLKKHGIRHVTKTYKEMM